MVLMEMLVGLGKRARDEPSGPKSKACREKMRRDKLNDRFLDLSSVMNPGKQAKLDKANILSDAAHMVAQLSGEAEKLKESNEKLRVNIKDLKVLQSAFAMSQAYFSPCR